MISFNAHPAGVRDLFNFIATTPFAVFLRQNIAFYSNFEPKHTSKEHVVEREGHEERLRKLKDDIEQAQERETAAKNAIRELDDKYHKHCGEKTTLKSRIKVVKAEYDKIFERLEESQGKLDLAVSRTEKSEVRRKQLAETEVDDFERSEEVENTLKTAAMAKENADHLVVGAERKVVVLERDLTRVQENYDKFAERADHWQHCLEEYAEEMRALEESDRDASEREDAKEEKVKFLETQVREIVGTAESHERNVGKLERLRDKLGDEIISWSEKREEIRHEMEVAMGGILDEDF